MRRCDVRGGARRRAGRRRRGRGPHRRPARRASPRCSRRCKRSSVSATASPSASSARSTAHDGPAASAWWRACSTATTSWSKRAPDGVEVVRVAPRGTASWHAAGASGRDRVADAVRAGDAAGAVQSRIATLVTIALAGGLRSSQKPGALIPDRVASGRRGSPRCSVRNRQFARRRGSAPPAAPAPAVAAASASRPPAQGKIPTQPIARGLEFLAAPDRAQHEAPPVLRGQRHDQPAAIGEAVEPERGRVGRRRRRPRRRRPRPASCVQPSPAKTSTWRQGARLTRARAASASSYSTAVTRPRGPTISASTAE